MLKRAWARAQPPPPPAATFEGSVRPSATSPNAFNLCRPLSQLKYRHRASDGCGPCATAAGAGAPGADAVQPVRGGRICIMLTACAVLGHTYTLLRTVVAAMPMIAHVRILGLVR